MSDSRETLEARVTRLEDIQAVQALCIAYSRFSDERDFEAYADLFSEDGVWVGPGGEFKGPQEILTMLRGTSPGAGRSCHILTNPIVDVDGDRASARITWSFITEGSDGAPWYKVVGHYVHTFVREEGGWKFLRRESTSEIAQR